MPSPGLAITLFVALGWVVGCDSGSTTTDATQDSDDGSELPQSEHTTSPDGEAASEADPREVAEAEGSPPSGGSVSPPATSAGEGPAGSDPESGAADPPLDRTASGPESDDPVGVPGDGTEPNDGGGPLDPPGDGGSSSDGDAPADGSAPAETSNVAQSCQADDECTGTTPRCVLQQFGPRVYMPPTLPNQGTPTPSQPDLCQADDECSSASPETPYCVEVSLDSRIGRRCSECKSNDDCALGSCEWGVCFVQCEQDSDCGRPETTSCIDGQCAQDSCDTDADCKENAACDAGACVGKPCSEDAECVEGACLENTCSALPGRCLDRGAVDPDPFNCVCGAGRICVTDVNAMTGNETGPRRCEPLPDGCDSCSCAISLCPQNASCTPTMLGCMPWLM